MRLNFKKHVYLLYIKVIQSIVLKVHIFRLLYALAKRRLRRVQAIRCSRVLFDNLIAQRHLPKKKARGSRRGR